MAKPAFVLLHGAWHSPRCWNRLLPLLEEAGSSVIAPQLPSSGSIIPPTPDWSKDVETIRETVSQLVEHEERHVVVVLHSFSGMTGGTALEGLDRQSRAARGLKGGVIRLVYIVAFLVPEGFRHSAPGTRDNMIPEMKTDFEVSFPVEPYLFALLCSTDFTTNQAGIITVADRDVKEMFYQDVEDENVLAELSQDLRPQSLASFWSTTTHAAWRHIPTTYVLCTKDRPTTVVAARYLIETAKASPGGHKIDSVIEVEAGHSPFISKPEWTAEMLLAEAARSV